MSARPSPPTSRSVSAPIRFFGRVGCTCRTALTQNEIAKVMGVSRAAVNACPAEAQTQGIVTLAMDIARLGKSSVPRELKSRFGLDEVVVIPVADPDRPRIERFGVAGTPVLWALAKPGDRIGVSWGAR